MKYLNVPQITFTNDAGISFLIYDLRVIPNYQIAGIITRSPDEDLDEIYTRKELAGSG